MKINKSPFIVLLFIIILGIAGTFITFEVSHQQAIKVSMLDLSAQLAHLENWKKWDSTLLNPKNSISTITVKSEMRNQSVTIQNEPIAKLTVINPALFQLELKDNPSVQLISLQPAENENFTNVFWISKVNVFQWLKEHITGQDKITWELNELKKFAESTEGIYGFPISLHKVTDLMICTKKEIVSPGNLQSNIKRLLAAIRQFLKTNKIQFARDYYYVSSSSLVGGKFELAVGVPVQTEIRPVQGIEFLKFPADGNLLVGTCTGDPARIRRLYAAMDKFVMDKRLNKVAQSMEKYTGEPGILNARKKATTVQLIYPVY